MPPPPPEPIAAAAAAARSTEIQVSTKTKRNRRITPPPEPGPQPQEPRSSKRSLRGLLMLSVASVPYGDCSGLFRCERSLRGLLGGAATSSPGPQPRRHRQGRNRRSCPGAARRPGRAAAAVAVAGGAVAAAAAAAAWSTEIQMSTKTRRNRRITAPPEPGERCRSPGAASVPYGDCLCCRWRAFPTGIALVLPRSSERSLRGLLVLSLLRLPTQGRAWLAPFQGMPWPIRSPQRSPAQSQGPWF